MINGSTKLICLIGQPVEHSFSPSIHNTLFEKYDINSKYICFDVDKDCLKEAVNSIKALKIKGSNVTVPHKVDIMEYLDEIDINAKLIGAVNTIKNDNGKLIGYNTDGIGFVNSVIGKGYKIQDKNVMILGAGGAARSIAVEIANNNAKSIEIRNRTLDKAESIAITINENFKSIVKIGDINITKEDLENIDILINTTSLGMSPHIDKIPIDDTINIDKDILVCDIVYNPKETRFLKWAKENNLNTLGGIDMLINQALEAFYIWTEVKPDRECLYEVEQLRF
ncbi:shikimate dehydrogenase [Tepidibacter hydrothermalis]|uniref:Shikimate dehydrogenase (NADP(+)) n=1 Tax=Tepidibacter hydrothermalis TaxID=3036126 RepID=A0ABY8EBM3_9FIRM|nr:shikimate dehydrogenase [Tepidibacter hydrothermalis]WFD08989.1 shikimate dehydrogenase [Tepidibacter hydrothermalis]